MSTTTLVRAAGVLPALIFALALAACSTHPVRVNCEGHLRPINPPTAAAVQEPGTP